MPWTEPLCWAAEMADSCLSNSDDGARPEREELIEKDRSDRSMLPRVGVEQEVSDTAGVGGPVMSSEYEDSGVLAPPPPTVSSPSLFLLLFFFGLSSGMMSEYSWMREAGPPEEAQGKEEGRGVEGEEEEESCPNR